MILQIIISNGILDLVTGILAKLSLGTGIWAKFRLGTGICCPTSRTSVYDPIGFLAPLVLRAKKILQEVCKMGVGWDDPVPEEVRLRWERWKLDLLRLKELQIPRCFEPKMMSKVKTYEVHSCSDPSTFGYGQCSYLRVKDED